MSATPHEIGERVLAALATVNAQRKAARDALRAEVAAILAEYPNVTAKDMQYRVTRSVSLRLIQQLMKEINLRTTLVRRVTQL